MRCEEGFCRIPKSAVEPGDGNDIRGGCSSAPASEVLWLALLLGWRRSRARAGQLDRH
jgi:hypothetical protein